MLSAKLTSCVMRELASIRSMNMKTMLCPFACHLNKRSHVGSTNVLLQLYATMGRALAQLMLTVKEVSSVVTRGTTLLTTSALTKSFKRSAFAL